MEIIIYSHKDNPHIQSLQSEVNRLLESPPLIVNDFTTLFELIREKVSSDLILVFLISRESELDCLTTNKKMMFNATCVIVLPKNTDQMILKGLQFRPRYLGYVSEPLSDVSLVLEKMISHRQVPSI